MTRSEENFGNWLAGFADGESSFLIASCRKGNRVTYQTCFVIQLRSDDIEILNTCRDRIGGTVKIYTRNFSDERKQIKVAMWNVRSLNELLALIDLFEQCPLRAKKKNDFDIWKQAVKLRKKLRPPSPGSYLSNEIVWDQIAELKTALEAGRKNSV